MIKLEIENRVTAYRADKKNLNLLLKKTIKILKRREQKCRGQKFLSPTFEGVIQLTFVYDKEIHQLNREYRGFDRPTDVLSFSYQPIPNMDVIGEIIISVETATKQAKKHKKTIEQEIQFLFIHGLLHVFGFDHELSSERKVMFDLQDDILETKIWLIEK